MKKRHLLIPVFIFLGFIVFFFSTFFSPWAYSQEYEEAKKVILALSAYHAINERYPDSIENVGFNATEQGPIHYRKINDEEYHIWFGTTLGNSMEYDSKTKHWFEHG
jgi:hypothetical protein